jgi:DNA-binding transcriptional regulator YiaG
MSAVAIDFRDLERVRGELADASALLARSEELPVRVEALLRAIAGELRDMDRGAWEQGVDPYLLVELNQVALAALVALEDDDEARRLEGAELALEAMVEVFADIEEGSLVSDERSGREIARWLKEATGASNRALADLLGVSGRKLERWLAGDSEPAGDDELRLRVAARLVNQLRHAMTGYGAVRWLTRPFPDLEDRSPSELLDDPRAAPRLLALAAQARRSDAG